jgi:predicted glycosyl hydrolase (DUF1957 family)
LEVGRRLKTMYRSITLSTFEEIKSLYDSEYAIKISSEGEFLEALASEEIVFMFNEHSILSMQAVKKKAFGINKKEKITVKLQILDLKTNETVHGKKEGLEPAIKLYREFEKGVEFHFYVKDLRIDESVVTLEGGK